MLKVLGLSETAEAVYRTMLAQPRLGIPGLCETLQVDELTVRASLDELARLTLVRESRDAPGEIRTVRPEVGLESLLRRQEEDLISRQKDLAALKSQVADVVAEYANLPPNASGGFTQRLLGLDAIQAQLETLTRDLAQECLSMTPGAAQSQASLDAGRPLDRAAAVRGVQILTLFQDSVRNDPATYGYARWLTDLGGLVRTSPVLATRMLIFDRQVAVIPIDPANTKAGALCTSEPGIVGLLASMFEQAWNTAVPLGADTVADPDSGLTPLERDLLTLLATGVTDEVAGRRLGVSGRTVRRQMSALMERLGATSRFEAGLRAAQRGWLLLARQPRHCHGARRTPHCG